MSAPPTQFIMLDFPARELPKFMAALCSALPGSVWSSEVIHEDKCPLALLTSQPDETCRCDRARVVIIKRLQGSTSTAGGNGAGMRRK